MKLFNPISLFILFLFLLASCSSPVFVDELPGIIGVDNVEILNDECVEDVSVGGEGYAIETYILTDKISLAFNNRASKVLPDKKDWLKHDWITGNRDTIYNEVYGVALNYMSRESMNRRIADIKGLLAKDGVFHAFYYKLDEDTPQQVYFFVYDTNSNTVYIIDASV